MKFLFVTDTHLTNMVPKYRTKDFFKQIMDKWSEVFLIAKERKVDFILHGGDIFHTSDPDVHVILETMKKMNKNIPVYLTVGNHDYKSNNFDNVFDTTAMGLLEHAGYLKMPHDDLIFTDEAGVKILVRMIHYFQKKDFIEHFTFKEYKNYDYCVMVAHATIVNQPVKFKHITVEDLAQENDFDLVLCGHYHYPFDVKFKNTRFINPGSMTRLTKAEDDMKRIPQVVIVDVAYEQKVKIEYIPLKSSVHWNTAFQLEQIEEDKEDEQRLSEEFSEAVQGNAVSSFNVDEVIDLLSEQGHVSKDVVTTCKKYLEEVKNG